ncbi:MAG: fructosamine kinase family protein [Cyanobium sp.]
MVRSEVDPLAPWLREQLRISLVARTPVGGGCIHGAWCLQTADGERLFAKTNRADQWPLLEAEAEGLRALARVAPPGLRVPTPLALGETGGQAVLVLPWMEMARSSPPAGEWATFGAHLARLHRRSLDTPLENPSSCQGFGWARDNFIGASPQPNRWNRSWGLFFTECRLRPQFQWLRQKGWEMQGAERLLERLPSWLDGRDVEPCLVHGDLWSGNGAVLAGGDASVFDPAVYRGDRETDLAMARLFGGFPEAFFEGYREEWPLAEGWRTRQDLYNLYHLLNHANLFGGSYKQQAQSVIATLLGLL